MDTRQQRGAFDQVMMFRSWLLRNFEPQKDRTWSVRTGSRFYPSIQYSGSLIEIP